MGIPRVIIGMILWGIGHATSQPHTDLPLNIQKTVDAATQVASNTLPILAQVQMLRTQGKFTEAEKIAIQHLKLEPKDVDVRLILGLIQKQQAKYALAESNLNTVLSEFPNYLDARIALIQLKLNDKKLSEAKVLIQDGLKITPKDMQLLSFETKVNQLLTPHAPVVAAVSHAKLKQISLLAHKRKNIVKRKYSKPKIRENEAHTLALANYYLAQHQEINALNVILEGLRKSPDNINLLIKKGEIQLLLQAYSRASLAFRNVLSIDPQNKKAKGFMEEISEINPQYHNGVNQIGFFTDNFYVNDLHAIWDYSTIYYSRDLEQGFIGGRVNYASRQQVSAAQFQLDYSPRLSRNIYLDLSTAFANQPQLFPKNMVKGEAYVKLNSFFEISGGAQYSQILSTYFNTYTGSLNLYWGNNWLSFRPYLFIPQTNNQSRLYTATLRHYFATIDHFISITAGAGTSPDISDLLTVDFIIIRNKLVNFTYEFPVLNHKFAIDTGIGYQQWRYPSHLVRQLYDAKLGVKYRF